MGKVLIVGINYAPEVTGIAPYTTGMAEALGEIHDVTVLAAHPHYPEWRRYAGYSGWSRKEVLNGVQVTRLRHLIPRNPGGVSRILSEATFAARVAFAARNADVVLMVTPALLPLLPMWALSRARRTPVGVIVHDLYGPATQELRLLGAKSASVIRRLESLLLRNATGLVAIHDRMADTIAKTCGVPRDRIRVIRNWTHVPEPSRAREKMRHELGWSRDEFVVLHAGNMGAKQGLEVVVEAAKLCEAAGAQTRFVLMGDGSTKSKLKDMAGNCSAVQFADAVPEAVFADVLAAADALLLHERAGVAEMCVPSKLTSYFAAGRPIIAVTSPDGPAADEIRRSGAGMLVAAGSASTLLAAVDSMRQGPSDKLGIRGRDYARASLGAQSALAAYTQWVTDLMNQVETGGGTLEPSRKPN